MAENIQSDIIINVDTSIGIAEIKNLQRQVASLNAQLMSSGAAQAKSAQNIQRNLLNNINATGEFAARVKTIANTTETFTTRLEKNKLGMGEYFRYAGGASKTFGRLFKSEFDTIEKVARERVKTIQTQYVKLGRDANGALKAISVRPLALDMENLATKTAIAAQKQQLMNQLLKQGSTNLLNFGKNTQWAGRQLMVGFSIPLAMLGTAAAKTFMQMEEQAIRFKRVYGESFTSTAETDKMISQVKTLANEFTKYGVAVEKTMQMAADAAAMGKQGAELLAQVNQATRLAVLGGVEQEQALETTISLTNAFGIAADQLSGKINFLNAVENQTVTSIEDLTIAVPKAGPVIQQLGGDVEDLAFFLTAMKEGGINASEGANALKSGLAALINPTGKASEMLGGLGVNIKGIVEANKGDVKGTVIGFAKALDTLDPLNRARAIEQLFGKFQFARLSTLFQNVIAEGSQASRVLKLSNSTAAELAILSERELKRVQDSPMYKFQKVVEDVKVALVPLGEAFLKAVIPIGDFIKGFLDKFNSMGDGAKQFAVIATTVVAGIGPILLMTFGLIANGAANLIKMFLSIGKIFQGAGRSSQTLGSQTEYMTQQQLEAAAVAASLDQTHARLVQTFTSETRAVNNLASAYARAVIAQAKLNGINLATGGPATATSAAKATKKAPMKLRTGIMSVPGPKGAGDVVPAMLSPGEAVIPAKQSQKYSGLVQAMITDSVPGFRFGRNPFGSMLGRSRVAVRTKQDDLISMLQGGKNARYSSAFTTGTGADYLNQSGSVNEGGRKLRGEVEAKVFGHGPDTPASQRPTYGYARTSPMQALINRLFGLKGKQYNAVTSGKKIGNQGENYWTNPKTGKYEKNPNYKYDSLQRYGDVDLITKRSVGRRSKVAVSDLLMDYQRSFDRNKFNMSPVPMSGKGDSDFDSAMFHRLSTPFGMSKAPSAIGGLATYTSNPKPPYVESYTPGGFKVGEISRIVAKDRSTAKALQKVVDQAGLRIKVTPQNAPFLVKALSGIIGSRFNKGTEEVVAPSWKSMSFDQKLSLQMSHQSEATSGTGTLSRSEIVKQFEDSISSGVRSGSFSRLKIDPDKLRAEFNKYIAEQDAKGVKQFKLYGNMVEPWVSQGNQGTANPNATRSGRDYLKELKTMPKGLFGSGILARLPQDHGILDTTLKSYITTIQKAYTSELKKVYGQQITEAQTQEMYKRAEAVAVKKVKPAAARRIISDANFVGRLGLTPGKPGGGDSGYTRQYLSNLWGNVQKSTRELRTNGGLRSLFGDKIIDQLDQRFLTKTKFTLPENLKAIAKPLLDSLPKQAKMELAKKLIADSELPIGSRADAFKETLRAAGAQIPGTPSSPARTSSTKPSKAATDNASDSRTQARNTSQEAYNMSAILGSGLGNAKVPAVSGKKLRKFGKFFLPGFANGVVSVPGPKGAGDVVPAMLSPGESVIPTKMSEKYAPLISGMVDGTIPGYAKGKKGKRQGFKFGDDYGPIAREEYVPAPVIPDASKAFGGSGIKKALADLGSKMVGSVTSGIKDSKVGKQIKESFSGFGARFKEELASTKAEYADRQSSKPGFVARYKEELASTKKEYAERQASKPGFAARYKEELSATKKEYADRQSAKQEAKMQKKYGDSYSAAGMVARADGRMAYAAGTEIDGQKVGGRLVSEDDMASVRAKRDADLATEKQALKQQKKENRARTSGRIAQSGMGLSMAVGMATAVPGAVGEAAQSAVGPISAATAAMSLIPGPWGLAAGVIAGAGVAAFQAHEKFQAFRAEVMKTAATMSSGMKAMKSLSEFAGVASPSEILAKMRQDESSPYNIKTGKNTFGGSYLQSEQGQGMVSGVRKTSIQSGRAVAVSDIATQLSQAIQTNVLTKEQAASIAMNLGAELKDHDFSANVLATITQLIGPGGEDITNKPLEVAARIITEKQSSLGSEENVGSVKNLISDTSNKGLFGVGRGNSTEVAAAEAKYSQGYQDMLEMGQQNLDNLELQHRQRIETLTASKDQVGIDKENAKYLIEKGKLQKSNADSLKTEYKYLEDLQFNGDTTTLASANQIMDNIEASKKEQFEGQDSVVKDAANNTITNLSNASSILSVAQRATLVAGIKIENVDDYTKLQQMFPLDQSNAPIYKKIAEVSIKYGQGAQDQLTKLGGFFGQTDAGKKSYEVFIDYVSNDADGQKILEDMTEITRVTSELNGGKPIDMGLLFDADTKKPTEALNKIRAGIKGVNDAIKKNGGKAVKLKYNAEFFTSGFSLTKAQTDYFNSLPPDQQKVYTTTYLTIEKTVDDAAIANWRKEQNVKGSTAGNWAASLTNEQVKQQIAGEEAQKDTEVSTKGDAKDPGDTEDTTGGGDKKEDPINSILARLKMVRDAGINASGGIKELQRALGKTGNSIQAFAGVEQNLFNGANVTQEFMDYYDGLDDKAKKSLVTIVGRGKDAVAKLKPLGKQILDSLRETSIGDYQTALVKQKKDLQNSAKAFQMLKDAGMSAKDALEVSKDASLANAIATKATTGEVLGLVDAYKQVASAATAAEKFQKTFDEASAAWSAKKNKLDIDFRVNTKSLQQAVTDAENEIASKTNQAGGLDDLQAGLTEIGWAEDEINKKYDLREEALDRISTINDQIIASQKSQLSIADSLSRGDISAAAAAIQDQRGQEAQNAIQSQKDLLGNARKAEIGGLTATVNGVKMTRKDIESKILAVEKEIFAIEEKRLEPARESIRLAEVKKASDLKALEDQELEWQKLENDIALAATAAWDYVAALKEAAGLSAQAVLDAGAKKVAPVAPTPQLKTAPAALTFLPEFIRNQMGYMSKGGMVPEYFANGGFAKGTDTIPAMLTPGEFIMSKYAVDNFGVESMKAINSGASVGSTVYNSYDLNVNVRSDANPNEIARAVMTQIKQVDSQRIRGVRL